MIPFILGLLAGVLCTGIIHAVKRRTHQASIELAYLEGFDAGQIVGATTTRAHRQKVVRVPLVSLN